jgi:hypothetical protein
MIIRVLGDPPKFLVYVVKYADECQGEVSSFLG